MPRAWDSIRLTIGLPCSRAGAILSTLNPLVLCSRSPATAPSPPATASRGGISCRSARWARLGFSLAQLRRAPARWAPRTKASDKACIMIFNLGAPSQLDLLDMKPDAPARDPRAVQADPHRRAMPSRSPRSSRCTRSSPTSSRSCAVVLSHRRGRARHRPPDDADRPAVHRRHQHAARRLRAGVSAGAARPNCRRTSSCPSRWARPAATCRTARTPASSARPTIRSCSRPTRRRRIQGARPAAAAGDRRGAARSAAASCAQIVDDTVKNFEASESAKLMDANFDSRLPPDDQHARPARRSTCRRSRRRSASATA